MYVRERVSMNVNNYRIIETFIAARIRIKSLHAYCQVLRYQTRFPTCLVSYRRTFPPSPFSLSLSLRVTYIHDEYRLARPEHFE